MKKHLNIKCNQISNTKMSQNMDMNMDMDMDMDMMNDNYNNYDYIIEKMNEINKMVEPYEQSLSDALREADAALEKYMMNNLYYKMMNKTYLNYMKYE
jgi:hypothetical protein